MYMLQLMFFISVNCCFSFVLNSLAYITIPKNNGKMKINWKKLTTTSFCYNIYKIYIKTLKLVILPLMNALYRFTQLTESVATFISFQYDSSCLHLLIHTGFLGWVIQMNQLQIRINTTRPHHHIDHGRYFMYGDIYCTDLTHLACSRRSDSGERCKVKGSAKK